MKKYIIILFVFFNFFIFSKENNNNKIIISDDLELIILQNRRFIHVSYINLPGYGRTSANGLLIIDKDSAIILDTPWTNAQTIKLFNWVKKIIILISNI